MDYKFFSKKNHLIFFSIIISIVDEDTEKGAYLDINVTAL